MKALNDKELRSLVGAIDYTLLVKGCVNHPDKKTLEPVSISALQNVRTSIIEIIGEDIGLSPFS